MKIILEIETVVGGFKIVAKGSEEGVPFAEGCAATTKQIPARIKELLAKHFAEPTS